MSDLVTDQDILGHLMDVEHSAAELELEAQAEADKRRNEAKQKAEGEYKSRYDTLISDLDAWYNTEKEKCDASCNEEFQAYAASLASLPKDVSAFNSFVDSVFFGK